MAASIGKQVSGACVGGAAGAIPADQVNVTIIDTQGCGSKIGVSVTSTIRDLKDAIADAVGLQAIAISVHKLTDSIFNHPMICKEVVVNDPLNKRPRSFFQPCRLKDIGIREININICQYLGPEYHALQDTMTLKEYGIVCESTLIINKKPFTDRDVLLDLYNRCGGETWTNSTNWGSELPLGRWYGVTCNADGAIESIDLRMHNLRGEIPDSLGNLQQLKLLDLSNNRLSGAIPEELGNLQQLKTLFLNNNQLRGEIPASLGNLQQLKTLDLSINQLTGAIPDSLGNLQQLEWLDLSNNRLSGAIPEELGNLQQLERLVLSNNQLSGDIPASLGNLEHLKMLFLEYDQLSGAIPASLGNLQNLLWLALTGNPELDVEGSEVIAALLARNVLVE